MGITENFVSQITHYKSFTSFINQRYCTEWRDCSWSAWPKCCGSWPITKWLRADSQCYLSAFTMLLISFSISYWTVCRDGQVTSLLESAYVWTVYFSHERVEWYLYKCFYAHMCILLRLVCSLSENEICIMVYGNMSNAMQSM